MASSTFDDQIPLRNIHYRELIDGLQSGKFVINWVPKLIRCVEPTTSWAQPHLEVYDDKGGVTRVQPVIQGLPVTVSEFGFQIKKSSRNGGDQSENQGGGNSIGGGGGANTAGVASHSAGAETSHDPIDELKPMLNSNQKVKLVIRVPLEPTRYVKQDRIQEYRDLAGALSDSAQQFFEKNVKLLGVPKFNFDEYFDLEPAHALRPPYKVPLTQDPATGEYLRKKPSLPINVALLSTEAQQRAVRKGNRLFKNKFGMAVSGLTVATRQAPGPGGIGTTAVTEPFNLWEVFGKRNLMIAPEMRLGPVYLRPAKYWWSLVYHEGLVAGCLESNYQSERARGLASRVVGSGQRTVVDDAKTLAAEIEAAAAAAEAEAEAEAVGASFDLNDAPMALPDDDYYGRDPEAELAGM